MKGKFVNICIGLLNILFSVLIIVFTSIIPQDVTLLTVQENQVRTYLLVAIYAIMAVLVLINLIEYILHKKDGDFKTGYLFALFILSFIFIKEPIIAVFTLFSGIFIVVKSIKENLIETNSMAAISIIILLSACIALVTILSIFYSQIGEYIKNKENEDELAYKEDYFRYVTELEGYDE